MKWVAHIDYANGTITKDMASTIVKNHAIMPIDDSNTMNIVLNFWIIRKLLISLISKKRSDIDSMLSYDLKFLAMK